MTIHMDTYDFESTVPSIYLAGKMNGGDYEDQNAGRNQDWRWPIIGAQLFIDSGDKWNDRWVEPNCFYVGPFCVYGKAHDFMQSENAHGVGAGVGAQGYEQSETVKYCLRAIQDSDLIFCWLNTKDAHGTLMELAYSCAIGKGKRTFLIVPPCQCIPSEYWPETHTCVQREVWFAQEMVKSHGGTVIYSSDPIGEIKEVFRQIGRASQQFNSVPEKQFWVQAVCGQYKGLLFNHLVSQHPVGKYRIDFAIPELKFGIEIDGLAYHNGQDSFMKDRSRQREIESQGWRIVRFAAKEVSLDVDKCFREAEAIAIELSQSLVGAK